MTLQLEFEPCARQAAQELQDCGLVQAFGGLVAQVWRQNLDRQDVEAGDTYWTLAMLSAANIKEVALRPSAEGGLVGHDARWSVDKDRSSLRFSTTAGDVRAMTLPAVGGGRLPDWNAIDWEGAQLRREIALRNSRRIQLVSREVGLEPLVGVEMPRPTGGALEFMIGWTGDSRSPLTFGYLFIPVLGAQPALCPVPLWTDEPSGRGADVVEALQDERLPYDEVSVTEAPLRLKPRPGREARGE